MDPVKLSSTGRTIWQTIKRRFQRFSPFQLLNLLISNKCQIKSIQPSPKIGLTYISNSFASCLANSTTPLKLVLPINSPKEDISCSITQNRSKSPQGRNYSKEKFCLLFLLKMLKTFLFDKKEMFFYHSPFHSQCLPSVILQPVPSVHASPLFARRWRWCCPRARSPLTWHTVTSNHVPALRFGIQLTDPFVVAVLLLLLPESQVQPVVFVLQQLLHRKHGGTKHVHLSHWKAHTRDGQD